MEGRACAVSVSTDPSQRLSQPPVIRTFPSPWSEAVGVGKGSPAPGTLCGQLVGRNSPSEPFLHLLFLKHHQFKSTDQDGVFWGDVS